MIRTSRPVSSPTSRIAVCSRVSPGLGVPFGSVQVTMSRSRRREPTTRCGSPDSKRTTIPPADVAVAVLSRATAPWRRWTGGPSRRGRNAPSASRWRDAGGRPSLAAAGPPGRRASRLGAGRATLPSGRRRTRGAGRRGLERAGCAKAEVPLARPRRRVHETGRRAGRVLRGDAVLHGPMVPRQTAVASDDRRFLPASGVSAPRASARAISRSAAAHVQVEDPGCMLAEGRQVGLERPSIAAGHRSGERRLDPQVPSRCPASAR